eukprot:TRINITY_DN5676_c0_g1_i1.p1 TRINITY_DN5676_c0_g1~~TRINITY_DN5676_c0_g1_i1.p1  ORF type:complete len:161 (+),score=33.79 TRINITY_DN5676_c0_g1_i1:240-722(+)
MSTTTTYTTMMDDKFVNSVMEDIVTLYEGKPNEQAFKHFSDGAQFEDSISNSIGIKEVKAQFYAIPKVFDPICLSKSVDSVNDKFITLKLSMKWIVKLVRTEVLIDHTIKLKLDKNNKITHFEDRWYNYDPNIQIPIIAWAHRIARRTNGWFMPKFITIS